MIKLDLNKYENAFDKRNSYGNADKTFGKLLAASAVVLGLLTYSVYKSDMKNVDNLISQAENYCNLAKSEPENKKEYSEKGLKLIKNYWNDSKEDLINFGFLRSEQLGTIEKKLKAF